MQEALCLPHCSNGRSKCARQRPWPGWSVTGRQQGGETQIRRRQATASQHLQRPLDLDDIARTPTMLNGKTAIADDQPAADFHLFHPALGNRNPTGMTLREMLRSQHPEPKKVSPPPPTGTAPATATAWRSGRWAKRKNPPKPAFPMTCPRQRRYATFKQRINRSFNLVFNEAIRATSGAQVVNIDMARGGYSGLAPVASLLLNTEVYGCWAALLAQDSAAMPENQPLVKLITLEDQDRASGTQAQINERCNAGWKRRYSGPPVGDLTRFRLRLLRCTRGAAIQPPILTGTQILACYMNVLLQRKPLTPVIALNRAVAWPCAMAAGGSGPARLRQRCPALQNYHLLPAARADSVAPFRSAISCLARLINKHATGSSSAGINLSAEAASMRWSWPSFKSDKSQKILERFVRFSCLAPDSSSSTH